MSRYLNNPNEVPPGGFRYFQAETKFLVTAPSWKDLLARVQAHRMANVIPIGSNFDQEIQDAVCAQAPPETCTDNNPNRTPEVPKAEWPLWALEVAKRAQPGDTGVGDIIARTVGPIGGDLFKSWFQTIFSKSCGCTERQESLNLQYPL